MSLVLDSGVLSRLCHPSAAQAAPVAARIERVRAIQPRVSVYIPEIADFEVRRKLLHLANKASVARLDALSGVFKYLPLDTPAMRRAAELWAQARARGQSTAPENSLDADVILAAQPCGLVYSQVHAGVSAKACRAEAAAAQVRP